MSNLTPTQTLAEIIESLTQASGAATALVHYSGNAPGFLIIRDALELTREGVLSVATKTAMLAPRRH